MAHDLCYMLPIRRSILRDTRAALSLPPVITRLRSEDWCFIFWQFVLHMSTSAGSRVPYMVFVGPVNPLCHDGQFDKKWKGCASVPKHWEFFKWTYNISNFDHWLKRMTCWCVISLRWCRIMAVKKCCTFRSKNGKIFYRPPLMPAVRCWPWGVISSWVANRGACGLECIHWCWSAAQHAEVRDSYLARMGPVVLLYWTATQREPTWIVIG